MREKNTKKIWYRAGALFLILLMVMQVVFGDVGNVTVQAAKKDKKAPSVTLYLNKTSYTRGSVNIMVKASDKSGIKSILIKKGTIKKKADKYWKNASNITKKKKKKVTSNGIYSVRVMDKAGNAAIKRITVTNIDKTAPSVSLSQSKVSGGVVVTVNAWDAGGIKSVKWIAGGVDDANSSKFNDAVNITDTRTFTVTNNGLYTVQVVDNAGNKAICQAQVMVKQALYDFDGGQGKYLYDYYGKSMTRYTSVIDSLNVTYTNALVMSSGKSGSDYASRTFYLAGEYQYFEGDIAAGTSGTIPGIFQIYADNVLVYTSPIIRPETGAVHFNVDIRNARFVKLKVSTGDWGGEYFILGNCYFYN